MYKDCAKILKIQKDTTIGYNCAMCTGYSEVVAKNKDTNQEISVVKFKTAVSAHVTAAQPHQIVITIPKNETVFIATKSDFFDGISVVYNFLPSNAPHQ